MKKQLRVFLFASVLVLSGCGSNQSFGPALTPSPTPPLAPLVTPTKPHPPCIETKVDISTPKVGDHVIIIGDSWKIGMASYTLLVRDDGAPEFSELAEVYLRVQVEISSNPEASRMLEFVSLEVTEDDKATFVVLAKSPGRVDIRTEVNGENYCSFSTGSFTAPEQSEIVTLNVTP